MTVIEGACQECGSTHAWRHFRGCAHDDMLGICDVCDTDVRVLGECSTCRDEGTVRHGNCCRD